MIFLFKNWPREKEKDNERDKDTYRLRQRETERETERVREMIFRAISIAVIGVIMLSSFAKFDEFRFKQD